MPGGMDQLKIIRVIQVISFNRFVCHAKAMGFEKGLVGLYAQNSVGKPVSSRRIEEGLNKLESAHDHAPWTRQHCHGSEGTSVFMMTLLRVNHPTHVVLLVLTLASSSDQLCTLKSNGENNISQQTQAT